MTILFPKRRLLTKSLEAIRNISKCRSYIKFQGKVGALKKLISESAEISNVERRCKAFRQVLNVNVDELIF